MNSYYYTQQYEAHSELNDMVEGLMPNLSEDYFLWAYVIAIALGILGMALLIFNVIAVKRARPLGVVAAVFQPIGMFAAVQAVASYNNIDFNKLVVYTTGSSYSEAMQKAEEKLMENFMEYILPQLVGFLIWALVLTAATVITAIYIIMMFKARLKVLAILAFVATVFRFFMGPVDLVGILLSNASETGQILWDFMFRFLYILPMFLLALQALIHMIRTKKEGNASVLEATAEDVPAPAAAPAYGTAPAYDAAPAEENRTE